MPEYVIILAPHAHQQLVLAALLREHNPALSFVPVGTPAGLDGIGLEILSRARLIAFTTDIIVPSSTLDSLGYGAYNFHPGSPAFPGWAPAHFAHYEGARSFGATAHKMIDRVDAGPIVGVETFVVPYRISVRELEQIAYIRLAYLFWRLAKSLATLDEPLEALPIEWGKVKSTRRSYASMCDIPIGIAKDELDRRIDSFDDDFRGMHPMLTINGVKFKATRQSADSHTATAQSQSRTTDCTIIHMRKRA